MLNNYVKQWAEIVIKERIITTWTVLFYKLFFPEKSRNNRCEVRQMLLKFSLYSAYKWLPLSKNEYWWNLKFSYHIRKYDDASAISELKAESLNFSISCNPLGPVTPQWLTYWAINYHETDTFLLFLFLQIVLSQHQWNKWQLLGDNNQRSKYCAISKLLGK